MYQTIDDAALGDVPWQSFTLQHDSNGDTVKSPSWMTSEHTVWFRDPHEVAKTLLANPAFADKIDFAPLRDYDAAGDRLYVRRLGMGTSSGYLIFIRNHCSQLLV